MDLYYKHKNLVNVSNSILRYFGVEEFHESLKELDEILDKNKGRKLCLILLDGFGKKIQEVYQDESKYVLEHKRIDISSVYPPTTVAATTALLSGKYPCETGWLGWTQKFEEYEIPVTMFPSTFVKEPFDFTPVSTVFMCQYESIIDLMRKHNNNGKYDMLQSFSLESKDASCFIKNLDKVCDKNDFLYAYCTEPDTSLHLYGVGSKEVGLVIKELTDGVESIVKKHPDVLFILLADHGHINVQYYDVKEHEDFFSLLDSPYYSLEARTSSFRVKRGKKKEFRELANKYYGNEFYILSKDEVKKEKVFGEGEECPRFDYFIGDFILISKGKYGFNQETSSKLVSTHAGSTPDEKYVNLSIYNER